MKKQLRKMECRHFLQMVNGTIDKKFENIRIIKSRTWNINGSSTFNFANLSLKNNVIVDADYGFAKYKGIELTNCQECYVCYPELRMKDIFTGTDC